MQIKLVSLNIWQGQALDAACSFLEKEKPDIITLQEVYDGKDPALDPKLRTLEVLKKRLSLPYYAFEAAFIENHRAGKMPSGNAIFSRFPIKSQDHIFFNEPFLDGYVEDGNKNNPTQPHILLHAVLETPAGEVNAYCLHGTWDLDGDNFSEKRKQMSEAVIAATKDRPNVILAGDTNAKPTNQAMRNVEEHLTSVFCDELTTTFNMSRKDNPGYATAAVDMAFISPDIRIVSKDCPDVDVSDHLPLVVTLEIPETNMEIG